MTPRNRSEDSIPPAYVWRADTTNRVVVSARQASGLLKRFINTGSEPTVKNAIVLVINFTLSLKIKVARFVWVKMTIRKLLRIFLY
jgi:hypothetical protein